MASLNMNTQTKITRDELFIIRLVKEIEKARNKFPDSRSSFVALVEEVGELAQAMLQGKMDCAWKEAIQVATMAMRVATEGDKTFNYSSSENPDGLYLPTI